MPERNKAAHTTKRIPQLEGLRFIMMIIILLSHFEFFEQTSIAGFYTTFLHNPTLEVDYFFMLSGFGLYLSLSKKQNNSKTPVLDVRGGYQRIRKLYPLYAITMIAAIPATVISGLKVHSVGVVARNMVVKAIISIPLIQSAFGFSQLSNAFNGVCWFLSCLFLLYIIAPKLAEKVRKSKISSMLMLIITIALTGFFYVIFLTVEEHTPFDMLSYSSPYFRVFVFATGMIVARMYVKEEIHNQSTVVSCIVSLLWFLFRGMIENKIGVGVAISGVFRIADVLICAWLLMAFVKPASLFDQKITEKLRSQKMVWLGKIATPFFLIHYVIRMYVGLILGEGKIGVGNAVIGAAFIMIAGFVLSVGWMKIQTKLSR